MGKRAILNKNIGIVGYFLKDRDFIRNIGNIGTLEGLRVWNFHYQSFPSKIVCEERGSKFCNRSPIIAMSPKV